MKNIFVKTLGCKVNTFDSHALENQFKEKGYTLVEQQEHADITVINTCSVTAVAEKEARYLLRRYKRENPESFRVVTGCYAQIDSGTLTDMDEVDFVVPNEVKGSLVQLLSERVSEGVQSGAGQSKLPQGLKEVRDNRQQHFKSSLTLFDSPRSERTRAFLKIQDGCNGFCSYCQIPWARGASRSVNPRLVLEQVKKLAEENVPEIVLTGIHIGDYGEDLGLDGQGQALFLDLLQKIFDEPGVKRLRISSLEPAELTDGLIQVLAKNRDKFCAHFHLPLQSGDDRILKLMNRSYTSQRYFQSVEMIREHFPDAQISADVIPGFPGETDEEFDRTVEFIKKCGIASLHVFPYSKRPNTAALRMPDHVDPGLKKKRAAILRSLSGELAADYARQFFGHEAVVLWEKKHDALNRWEGKTRNYIQVLSPEAFEGHSGLESRVSLKGFLDHNKVLAIVKD